MEKKLTQQELDEIAERVFEAYKTRNVSEIARSLGEKPANIHKFFSGINRITPIFFIQVSEKTGYSAHWLLTGEGNARISENMDADSTLLAGIDTLSLDNNGDTVIAFVLKRGTTTPIPITDPRFLEATRKAYLALYGDKKDNVDT